MDMPTYLPIFCHTRNFEDLTGVYHDKRSYNPKVILINTPQSLSLHSLFFLSLLDDGAGSTEATSSSGGDEADLPTSRGISSDGGWFTDVLMVTTAVGMFNRLKRRHDFEN